MSIEVHPEVQDALRDGRAVVALESAVLTTGVPAAPLGRPPSCEAPGWDPGQPVTLELARLLERVVRGAGAVPATVAVVEGTLRIGLEPDVLGRLLDRGAGARTSASDAAVIMAGGGTAGTTVSATLLACRRTGGPPIQVLATGGIGGVHRAWVDRPDVSADLRQLAITPVCVVASGVKSILDAPATMEVLEALGVPMIAYGTDLMPRFYGAGDPAFAASHRIDDVAAVAAVCRSHWRELGCRGAVLVANPVPAGMEVDAAAIETSVAESDHEARRLGITGSRRTPHVLEGVFRRTQGKALDANIALLAGNARLAARVALALGKDPGTEARGP